jgi:hypothetical protein
MLAKLRISIECFSSTPLMLSAASAPPRNIHASEDAPVEDLTSRSGGTGSPSVAPKSQ